MCRDFTESQLASGCPALSRYRVKVGLTNFAAAYCYGLLLVRRILQKYKIDTMYEGIKNIDGTLFRVEDNVNGPGAFRACLDVGLARTSTSARVSDWDI